jgi:DNA-binding response OmpR family regulator
MGAGKRPVDYGMAEALAFGSLVKAGVPVRLSGQDSRRGTFNQRHSVLLDIENEQEYMPLQHISEGQARCEIYNSTLSEAGVLGFEYGYSRDYPEALVLWEAQFGDFANVAQAVIDQFISAGEEKWKLLSGVVMLLPHGYEGQGPEHSSARIERFLQLAARDNFQICQPSNAAQYFHLLRRQALRKWRKPLIVFTPKSMLRHPDASSPIEDFAHPHFLNVLPDTEVSQATRVLLCTGKIGHELRDERKKRKDDSTAIVFLEQMYPFPEAELSAELERHASARDIVWVQEEPANMGAMPYVLPRLRHHRWRTPCALGEAQDGLELCRTVRQTQGLAAVPVIFLTAKSSEADRVLGLEIGADDYIAKPFSPRELVARVKAVLRRFERPLPPSPLKVGDIEIDPSAMVLTVRGQTVPTTATEFRLLDYFARHLGRVFSRDHLLDSVWRDTSYVTPRSVDVYVRRIREKIEPDPENPRYLKTVRGAGYRFEAPK